MSQFCNGTVCVALFSQADFTDVTKSDIQDKRLMCASGYAQNGICARMTYVNPTVGNNKGVMSCDMGSNCSYTIQTGPNTTNVLTQQCACTLSATAGQGVCPRALHDDSNSGLLNKAKVAAQGLNTASASLHTVHRMSAAVAVKDSQECARFSLGAEPQSAQFINSVACAKTAIGYGQCSSGFIAFSFLLVLLFAFLI